MPSPGRDLASEVLSTGEAALSCAVDRRTMLRWLDAGLVPSHQTGGGRRRVLKSDLSAFMRARGIPLSRETGRPPRVAIVDDEPAVVRALRRLVLRHVPGAAVRTAADGFAAGVLVAGFHPDLVLLDVVMPGMSGLEVCRQVKSDPALSPIAIVVVTAHLTPALEADLSAAGADRCLRKPFTAAEIHAALDRFVGSEGRPRPGRAKSNELRPEGA